VPTTPPAEALMVVVPMETGDASPPLVMVAMVGLLDVQAAVLVTSPTEPSENVACAVNCCVWPDESEMNAFVGLTAIVVMILLLTVIGAVAVTLLLLDFAVMVAFPRATAVASPEVSIVAIFVADDDQVT